MRRALPVRHIALRWLATAGLLHLAWEVLQLPLYTIFALGKPAEIAFAVGHCTAGDVLIGLASYGLASAATRDMQWPLNRPAPGVCVAIATGMAYTAFSEWLNVSVRGSWAYAAAMPLFLGIGLSPLLQWLVVPATALYLTRAKRSGHKQ